MEIFNSSGELVSRGSAVILTPADANGRVFTVDNREMPDWREGSGGLKMTGTVIIIN